MTVYKSIPHKIEAFQFTSVKVRPPEWFLAFVRIGQANVTNDVQNNDQHISLYDKAGGFTRVEIGDWVIYRDEQLHGMKDEIFKGSYIGQEA